MESCSKDEVECRMKLSIPPASQMPGVFYIASFEASCYSGTTMTVRMRHTRAHTANRRSHHALKSKGIATDKETGTPHLRHRVSLATGKYRGRQVLDIVSKVEKKQKKAARSAPEK